MTYETWMTTVPREITDDLLWKMEVYRLSLFITDLGWHDVTKLAGDKRMVDLAGQLYRALGSIEANISEGYSRGGGRDRARFYEYALGSARESRGWYYKGRHVLRETVAEHRIRLLTHIIRLLLKIIPDQRTSGPFLHEDTPAYQATAVQSMKEASIDVEEFPTLLQNIPMS
jgi:four helix bundle protein